MPLLPSSVALVAGVALGLQAGGCPVNLAVLLFGLGLALRGFLGWPVACLAAGLAMGSTESATSIQPTPERPVTLEVRLVASWKSDARGWRAPARGVWLRQGLDIGSWNRELWIANQSAAMPSSHEVLRIRGFLRRGAPAANGYRTGSGPWILRVKSARLIDPVDGGLPGPQQMLDRLGRRLRTRIERRLDPGAGGAREWCAILVRVLVLGRAEVLPDAVARGLRAAGLAHLVALSGLHVGLLAGMVLMASHRAPTWLRFGLTLLLVGGYVCVAGVRPSLIRASFMMMAVLSAWLLRRPPLALNTLGWVAAVMVLMRPSLVTDVGFHLTFAATGGILILAPLLQLRWRALPMLLRQALGVSVGAHLAALPWTLDIFHLATPLAPIWNLLAIPWASLTLALAFGWVLCPPAVPGVVPILEQGLELSGRAVEFVGDLPPSILRPIPVEVDWWAACLLSTLLTAFLLSRGWLQVGLGVCLGAALVLSRVDPPSHPEVVLIDVGQGDAILLRDGEAALLVDGGGWSRSDIAQRILIPTLARLGVRRLRGMVMTHPDVDHCAGLLGLASYLPIDVLYTAPGWHRERCAMELLARPGPQARPLWRGEQLELGRWKLRVLHPGAGSRQGRNDRSIAILAATGRYRVVLTGDLERAGELAIVAHDEPIGHGSIDILKVAHHGSQTSSSPELLARLRPRLALISCGSGNRYGHPAEVTLKRLALVRARVFRTDLHGAVRVSLAADGHWRIVLPGLPKSH